ncbi:sortase [Rugosimonospora acidiphila]|uniref:Sortase n=1 Tax=Rugosimonospora acidiphila TaxID=556531 RepID=A0ABP9RQG8_9ACTN
MTGSVTARPDPDRAGLDGVDLDRVKVDLSDLDLDDAYLDGVDLDGVDLDDLDLDDLDLDDLDLAEPARAAVPPRRRPRRAPPAIEIISTSITLLSVALLGFALYLGFGARLHHDRAQLVAYANFRSELALATAPTGQTVPGHPHQLLKLGAPVAVLQIPKLGLKEVVFEGTTGAVLEDGPGHLRSTPLPGQAGTSYLMGRAATYGAPFRHLSQLLPGDTFTVTTGLGVNKYRVLDIRQPGLPQPLPPAPGASRLVLTTAYGGPIVPTDVLRVDADLTSEVQPSPRLVIGASQLSPAESAMAVDSGAWFPMVFIGEALVLAIGLVSWLRLSWGAWQAWAVAIPVVGFLGLATADQAARLLPNLM